MFDPTMMAMLLDQFTQRPESQNQKGRPSDAARAQQHYPQAASNSTTRESRNGVQSSGWDAVWGEDEEDPHAGPYQSTGFSIPERGAARRYPAFQEMKNFARERGARDDSMIAPHSTPWEDEANMGRLDYMTHLAGGDLAEAVLRASPEQRELITDGEAKLEAKLREEEDMGSPIPLSRQRMMYAQNVDDLHQQGLVSDDIGQRNREYMQLLETRDRSAIDMGLKYGWGPPIGADPLQVEESAFNPHNREAHQHSHSHRGEGHTHTHHGEAHTHPHAHGNERPRAEVRSNGQTAEVRGGVKEVKLDKWGEGPASSTWGALRSAGWTDKEIIDNKLVDKVGQMNGLEDPAKVEAGATLKVPSKGGGEQKGALYEADGGPAHSTPSWERKDAPAPAPRPQAGSPTKRTEAPQPRAEEKPPAPPYDPSKDATALYDSMHGGLLGAGTDEEKLFKALEGKSPDQIKAIRAHYKDHYDRDLDKDLVGDLGGKELTRAQELMKGNQAAADADRLNHAMKGGLFGAGTDEKAVYETFEGKTPEQRQAILDEYKKRNNGVELKDHLKTELSGAELDRANALVDGNQARADAASMRHAMKGGFLGMGTDEDAVYKALEGKTPEQRDAILKEYGETYKDGDKPGDLKGDLQGELSGAELDRADALLRGDKAGADAAALNHAMKGGLLGIGTDKDTIYKTFEGKSEDERKAIVDAYGKYGSLDTHFTEEMGGNDLEKAQKLVTDGKLSDVDRLRYAMEGAGTDEDEVKAVLAGKSKAEIDALRGEYQATTSRSLDSDLSSDLSGRELFDAQMDLKGRPESAEEAVQRQNERWEYERGEGNSAGNFFVDLFSDKGQLLDRNTARMNEQLDRVDQLKSEGRYAEAREAEQRLSQLVDYTQDDVSSYREAKDSAAETAGTVAATAASVAVVIGTAGTATPLVVAGLAATAGAGAKVMTASAIQGRGYGWEAGLTDAGTGAIDGLSTAVGAKAGQVAASSVGKAMASRAEATLARQAAAAGANVVDDAAKAGTVAAETAATGTTQVAATGTTQAATTGTTQAATTGAQASRTLSQRMAVGATEGAVDGTVGGAAGGAGYTAMDENTWKDGFVEGLGRVAEGTALGAGAGMVAGGVVGGGIPAAGKAISQTGDAAAWTGQKLANAGDALRDGAGRLKQAGQDAMGRLRGTGDNVVDDAVTPGAPRPEPQPQSPGVLGRLKKAGQDFYDYGMEGGYLGKRLKGTGADDVAPAGPRKAANDNEPLTPGKADNGPTPVAPEPDAPTPPKADGPTPPEPDAPTPKADGPTPPKPDAPTPKADGPTPPKPDAPVPPTPDKPKPGALKQFYDFGMNGGVLGNWLKKQDLGGQGRQILDDLGARGRKLMDDMGLGNHADNAVDDATKGVKPRPEDVPGNGGVKPNDGPPPVPEKPVVPKQPTADETAAAFRRRVEQFPDQEMLGRFRDQSSFQQLTPEQQHGVLELAARHKPEQPTGMLAKLFGPAQQPSAMEGHLQKLIRDGRLTNVDANGTTLLDNLNQLDQAPRTVSRGLRPQALSEEVAATVAYPAGVIKQGRRGTCSATSVQYIHAYKNPSDYARVMKEMVTEGEATLVSGKKMTLNRTALGEDGSGRRTADKLYQASAMNHASGRYDNNVFDPTDGGKGGHVKPDGTFDYDGLDHKQANKLMRDIMGERYEAVGYESVSLGGTGDSPEMRARFQSKLMALKAEGEPMHAALSWGEKGHSGHAINVEDMDDKFVYIRNPHGNEARTNLSSANSAIVRENVGHQGDGFQRITHDEFFGRLRAYQSRPTSPRERHFVDIGESYAYTIRGEQYADPAALAHFKERWPDTQIDHLDADARREFFIGFEDRLHAAGQEAAPRGMGNYQAKMAELNEYMKNFGYPNGDFGLKSYGIA